MIIIQVFILGQQKLAAIAMSTDYDCWKEDEKPVSWDEILEVFHKNAVNVKNLLIHVIPKIRGLK